MTNKENGDEKKKDNRERDINNYFVRFGVCGMFPFLLDDSLFV